MLRCEGAVAAFDRTHIRRFGIADAAAQSLGVHGP
jgi:hypothetical protein